MDGDVEEEEEWEGAAEVEMHAMETHIPGEEVRTTQADLASKHKESTPDLPAAEAPVAVLAESKRGRKSGGPKKDPSRPWTERECISLLEVRQLIPWKQELCRPFDFPKSQLSAVSDKMIDLHQQPQRYPQGSSRPASCQLRTR